MSKEAKTNTQQRTAPGGMMRPGGLIQKPKNTGATIKRMMGYMKKSIILIIVTFVLAVLGTLMQVISPKVLGNATTLLFDSFKNGTELDFKALGSILLVVALLYVGVSLTNYFQIWIMTHVSQKTTFLLRGELKAKMNSVPISYFDKHSNGNLMSIAVNDMDNIATTLQQSLMQLISSVVLVTGTIWFMFTISPLLTIIAFLLIPGSFLVTKIVMPKTQANFRKYLTLQGELNGHIEESYNAHAVIKSFNGEAAANRKFDGFNDAIYDGTAKY